MSHSFKEDPRSDFPDESLAKKKDPPKELLLKELTLNEEEQSLLSKRIQSAHELLNDLPNSDPQYNMLKIQSQMDRIEIDELKRRVEEIKDILKYI